jgi:hypothetical protein
MYADMDFMLPYFPFHVQDRSNGEESSKGVFMSTGNFVDSATMLASDFEESDLFNAPISADICNDTTTQNEVLVTEEDIALMQISLQDELLLYTCNGARDLPSSITEPNPSPSLIATQVSSPSRNLTSSSAEVVVSDAKLVSISQSPDVCFPPLTKRIQDSNDVPMSDAKLVSISQSPEVCFPPLSKRIQDFNDVPMIQDSNDVPMLGSKENMAVGDSSSPVSTYMESPHKIQRSFSSHALGQYSLMHGKPSLQFSEFQGLSMRRVYSTGDIKSGQGFTVPFESNRIISEDKEFRIGQYTVEERRERIHRYRKKRTERNFNKKIKYACRKSLADNQPRVRGRFASKTRDVERSSANAHLEEDQEEVVWIDAILYELCVMEQIPHCGLAELVRGQRMGFKAIFFMAFGIIQTLFGYAITFVSQIYQNTANLEKKKKKKF